MTPLMFGPGSRKVFGLFHAPDAPRARALSVLICPPFGQEGLRTHRFLKVLSERLSRAGVGVLRFDFHGSGDSPGLEEEGDLDGWRRDVCAAHVELRRLAPADRIVWLGVRLGGTLALMAARNGRCDPARLVLWEPVVAGRQYLRFLREQHVKALDNSFCIPDVSWRRALVRQPDAVPLEALGTLISPTLGRQLDEMDIEALPLTALHDTVVLAHPGDRSAAAWAEAQQLRNMPMRFSYFQHSLVWTSDPFPNSAMVPAEALQRLQEAIHE